MRRPRVPRWLLPLAVLGAVGFLYVRPIDSYLQTRNQLDQRRAEVAMLRAERARLNARLEQATSVDGLARQARRIGYVRPGEHLFIVEGTAAWAKQH
jgi:cell division protein FtsB